MTCESFDWKAYALGELAANERREAEAHVTGCDACRNELAHVRLTIDTLAELREEEIPRRIAFVSDKVFKPRWWEAFPRPSFAAALVVAAAIVAHGYITRPAAVDDAALQKRVGQAVSLAVADLQQQNASLEGQITYMYTKSTGIKYQ